MLNFLFSLLLLCTFMGNSAVHPFEDVVRTNGTHPVLLHAFETDLATKTQAIEDLDRLLIVISKSPKTPQELLEAVRARVCEERKKMAALLEAAAPYKGALHWNVKSQKMGYQLDQLLGKGDPLGENLLNEDTMAAFLARRSPIPYKGKEVVLPAIIEKFPNLSPFWGTTQGTRLEMLLCFAAADTLGTSTLYDTLEQANINPRHTALAHFTALPDGLVRAAEKLEASFFYAHPPHDAQSYFGSLHTGFLFGGCTGESLSGGLDSTRPFDCSSYSEFIMGGEGNAATSTLYHYLYWARDMDPETYAEMTKDYTDAQHADIRVQSTRLSSYLQPVAITADLPIGCMFGWRGKGGHVGIYAGSTKKGDLVIMSTNRGLTTDMREGTGFEVLEHNLITNPLAGFKYYAFVKK